LFIQLSVPRPVSSTLGISMSVLHLVLVKKQLTIQFEEGDFKRKLSFEIEYPRRERFRSSSGEEILEGYVEFGDGSGKFEKPLMTYIGPQIEEGALNQASFSFYAFLPKEDFQNLVSLGHDAQVILYIRTEDLDGPIQFGSDIDGYEKIWKTEMGTRVAAESFELLIIYSGAGVI